MPHYQDDDRDRETFYTCKEMNVRIACSDWLKRSAYESVLTALDSEFFIIIIIIILLLLFPCLLHLQKRNINYYNYKKETLIKVNLIRSLPLQSPWLYHSKRSIRNKDSRC